MRLPDLAFDLRERCDLHAHSHWSDGQHSPTEIARLAARAGLRAFALTDHAEVGGTTEAILAGARLGVWAIPAVELNALDGNILGYFVDHRDERLGAFLAEVRAQRRERVQRTLARLRERGVSIDPAVLERLAEPGDPSRTTIARVLADRGLFRSIAQVQDELLGEGCAAWVEPTAPDAEPCLRAVREAGGVAVLGCSERAAGDPDGADPAQVELRLTRLAEMGLAGCELPPHDPHHARLRRVVAAICERLGLVALEGSNFHGAAVQKVELGGRTCCTSALRELASRLPAHGIHRDFFKRMAWRAANLTPEEFAASLQPEDLRLDSLELAHLLDRPGPLRPPREACGEGTPFVLVGPGGLAHLELLVQRIEEYGARVIERVARTNYPELLWDLFGLAEGEPHGRERGLLRFELERRLYGDEAERCCILFFEPRSGIDLRMLKARLRASIGPLRFWRVGARGMVEDCFTTYLHIPAPERVALECARMQAHGVAVPRRA